MGKKNLIDCIITVGGEKIPGKGEDSAFADFRDPMGIIGVFDGCGGIGSKKYASMDNNSGAYLASRAAKTAAQKWFAEINDFDRAGMDALSENLKKNLVSGLDNLSTEESSIKGSLAKEFPTTLSIALFKQEKKSVLTAYIWAGDSRGYVLEPRGLVQITRDDIVGGGDAFSNLREDARLSNFVSAEGDFVLNRRTAEIEPPAMLICATDGCFGYFETPMEFEYVILETLFLSDDLKGWKNLLKKRIEGVSGDDFAMHICLVGCGGVDGAKKIFKKRKKRLEKDYISKLKNAGDEKLKDLWNQYKEEYYG